MNNGYGSGKDTRQTALRDLYVKLGGNIADVAEENDINRLIRDLGDVAGGGGGGGVLVVTDTDGTLDKTWQEIHDAMLTGGAVISDIEDTLSTVVAGVSSKANKYVVDSGGELYIALTADGYPAMDDGGAAS